jgi:cation diffusion facilitator family transporter
MSSEIAQKEKLGAALGSVAAAVLLTVLKVVVGLLTGSLGILAEAAHSGLDLVAAIVTYIAVHIASKPADRNHLYGHGKVENLSALVETLLLLVTCGWIIHEAVDRLFYKEIPVDASVWGFVIMGISIVVDVHRSRMLYKAARKHHSQALEADALHFRTDIWSSAVVILGLGCVKIAEWQPSLSYLKKADALAALMVAVIVVVVSLRLGFRSIGSLMDVAPSGVADRVKEVVESIPGVVDCHQIRVRHSGPHLFIDIHVYMDGAQTLQQAHDLSDQIEQQLQHILADADVTVHPEPDPGIDARLSALGQDQPG